MKEKPLTLDQRARRAVIRTVGLGIRASVLDWTSAPALEAFAAEVSQASSDLNGAALRMRRLAKKLKKIGAAGAVNDTQGKDHGSRE